MIPYDREIVKHSIIYRYAIVATPPNVSFGDVPLPNFILLSQDCLSIF